MNIYREENFKNGFLEYSKIKKLGKEVRLTEVFERKHLKCTWRTKRMCYFRSRKISMVRKIGQHDPTQVRSTLLLREETSLYLLVLNAEKKSHGAAVAILQP